MALDVYPMVRSAELKRWRVEQPAVASPGDVVATGRVGHLLPQKRSVGWNLAEDEHAVVAEVVRTIEEHALPWFATVCDPPSLAVQRRQGAVPNMHPRDAVEVLVWLGEREAAEEHVRVLLRDNAGLADQYELEMARLGGQPLTGDEPQDLGDAGAARAVAAHGLAP